MSMEKYEFGDVQIWIWPPDNDVWFYKKSRRGILSPHRDGDLPATCNQSGHKRWYKNGAIHRHSGPAIIYPDGKEEFWWKGIRCSDEIEFLERKTGIRI